MTSKAFLTIMLLSVSFSLSAQSHEQGTHDYVIRGSISVEFEPIYAGHVDSEYPLDVPKAGRRALEEAAVFFSAMIYGWSFNYEIGERARRINEEIELKPIGVIQYGDPSLKVTDTEVKDMRLMVWMDYQLSDSQQRRMQMWQADTNRNAQAVGFAPASMDENPGWLGIRKMALDDAARTALRAMLRGSERNRPKEVTGFISLASFPRYYVDSGRQAASARFRVQITEIIPFAVH